MTKKEITIPQMGEGVIEATLTKWLKNTGDQVKEDEPIAEIATDKVDSEITSPVTGILEKTLYNEGDVVPVGETIAIIRTGGENADDLPVNEEELIKEISSGTLSMATSSKETSKPNAENKKTNFSGSRFYSPLVKNIAEQEGITMEELNTIQGSGKDGRVTKNDVLAFLKNKDEKGTLIGTPKTVTVSGPDDEIIEMDRMRKLIADNMLMSVKTSPHVTSFIDVDLTRVVKWRDQVKDEFYKREGVKLTFTPIFFEAAALALKGFPKVNASVDGYNIILHKNINIGMATALPNGNLIVPVIKDADKKSLPGLTQEVNDLAFRARNNKLMPNEVMGGTFTITNFGSFDSLTGTPIINQPQVAILAIGAIRKKPVVLETESGDVIAIRNIVILSMAYDHRIVDGAMGGMFLKEIKEILENWDMNRKI